MARDTENSPQEGLRPAKRYLKASGREQEGLRVSVMTPLFDKILNLKNSTLVEDTEEMVKSDLSHLFWYNKKHCNKYV